MKYILARTTAILGSAALVLTALSLPAQAASTPQQPLHHNELQIPDTVIHPRTPLRAQALGGSALPASVDLTQWATAPGDQGQVGSCVSWAIGHTMLGWYANKAGTPQQFAPMYLYSQTHLDNSADGGGSYAQDAYAITEQQGIDTQADYMQGDMNFRTLPTAAQRANAAQYKTVAFNELFVEPDGNAGTAGSNAIKEALAAGTPVGLGIPIYKGFNYLDTSDYTWDTKDDGSEANYQGGHYLVALGYNSTGVIVENSWGSGWGNHGFATLTWDFVQKKVNEAETLGSGFTSTFAGSSYTAPTAPRNLKMTGVTTTAATVLWNAPLLNGGQAVDHYNLTISGGGHTQTFTVPARYSGEKITGFKPYTTYTYKLTATNAVGTSPAARITFKTKALTPKFHTVKRTSGKTSIKLTWTAASARSGHVTGYTITVKKAGKTITKRGYKASTRHATLGHLKRHTTYKVTLTVKTSAGKTASKTYLIRTK